MIVNRRRCLFFTVAGTCSPRPSLGYPPLGMILSFILASNDEYMRNYQQRRTAITGLRL